MKNTQKIAAGIMLFALLAFLLAPFIMQMTEGSKSASSNIDGSQPAPPPANAPEPSFKKDGELWFLDASTGDTTQHIEIEIADNHETRQQGLMHRSSMKESRGMLFIFDKEEKQSFWMVNTKFSLDIIYLNKNYQIVSIQKYTTPFSDASVPSNYPAQYVIEVNAGFCDKFGIKVGDQVDVKRDIKETDELF